MDDRTSKSQNKDANRAERLIVYANDHGEDGLEEFVRLLFPEWFLPRPADSAATGATLELPSAAPETYQGLAGPETPPEFVQRVYGPWLGHGLTRAHIRKLDWTLYQAIMNWLSRPQNSWPADVDLPTKADRSPETSMPLERARPMGGSPLLLRASRLEKQGGSEELFSAAQNDAICSIGHLSRVDSDGAWHVARLPFEHDGPAPTLTVPSV